MLLVGDDVRCPPGSCGDRHQRLTGRRRGRQGLGRVRNKGRMRRLDRRILREISWRGGGEFAVLLRVQSGGAVKSTDPYLATAM